MWYEKRKTLVIPRNTAPPNWPKGWVFPGSKPPGWPVTFHGPVDIVGDYVNGKLVVRCLDGYQENTGALDGYFLHVVVYCNDSLIRFRQDGRFEWHEVGLFQIEKCDVMYGIRQNMQFDKQRCDGNEVRIEVEVFAVEPKNKITVIAKI